jgi:hypothetical protein
MSDLHDRDALPPQEPSKGWFDPTPEKLIARLPWIKTNVGEASIEYAALLVQIGDAHMRQSRLSNPQAQDSYEAALKILQVEGDETAETAWIHDKLASVKKSSGDSFGAQADLEKALRFWSENPPANRLKRDINANHVARREEDLQGLRRLNAFLTRKPPGI